MSKNHLDTQIMVIGMASFVVVIGVVSIKIFDGNFDPIPWLTLIIGGAFGLSIAIMVNNRSKQVLDFISKAEQERQDTTNRTINNNAKEIEQLAEFYFDVIKEKSINTKEKKELLNTFLPRFKTVIAFSQSLTPSLGNSILKKDLEKIEECLKLLNKLLLILEYGNDVKFENNILKLSEYSKKLINELNKSSN